MSEREQIRAKYPLLALAMDAFDACVESMPLNHSQKERLKDANTASIGAYGDAINGMIETAQSRFIAKA